MQEQQSFAVSASPLTLLLRAAAFCEAQASPEGHSLAAELRASAQAAASEHCTHLDFAMCQELEAWNHAQSRPPIRPGCEFAVGLEAFRLAQLARPMPGQAHVQPLLVLMADNSYRVLPQELPEHMLKALALVSDWIPPDDTGEDLDRTMVLEGWEALVAMAPPVVLTTIPPIRAAEGPAPTATPLAA
jgi:hypothetical protein